MKRGGAGRQVSLGWRTAGEEGHGRPGQCRCLISEADSPERKPGTFA